MRQISNPVQFRENVRIKLSSIISESDSHGNGNSNGSNYSEIATNFQ